ncbi:MAG: tetratricopeptide repeat protein, partial [Promethearchaeota archaeon]
MLNKLEILQLIDQNKFDEAFITINNLETNDNLVLEDHLTLRLLKSQVLVKTGKSMEGLKFANEILMVVQDQVPVNQSLLVDAIITKTEALRWTERFSTTFSKKKMSKFLQLLEQGERILVDISNMEPLEKIKKAAVFQRNKGIIYRSLGEFDRAEKHLLKSVALYKKAGDTKCEVETLVDLAKTHEFKNEPMSQLKILHKCLTLYEELEDQEGIAEIFLYIAQAYQIKGEPEKATTYVQRSLKISDALPRTFRIGRLLFKIGLFSQGRRDD